MSLQQLRSPYGTALCLMFDHAVPCDLNGADSEELRLLNLLMRLAGNNIGYERSGITSILFPNMDADIDALRTRAYLVEPMPMDALFKRLTIADLKTLLVAHGLRVSGKRADLLNRLLPVLTDDELVRLQIEHAAWWPSDYGYEMLYSYYFHWEEREWAVINAIANNNIPAIINTVRELYQAYPDDEEIHANEDYIRSILDVYNGHPTGEVELRAVFMVLLGIDCKIWFHNADWGDI